MLRTGIKEDRSGFSLIEVMMTVCVLSLGTVLISQSNLTNMNVYGKYIDRLSILSWMDEKIWEVKEEMLESESPGAGTTSGDLQRAGNSYDWEMTVERSEIKDLYQMHLSVRWADGSQQAHLYRDAYLYILKD